MRVFTFLFFVEIIQLLYGKANNYQADQSRIMALWDEHMKDFRPDDSISFTVNAKEIDTIIEEIAQPTKMRGTFFVNEAKDSRIDFNIISPSGINLFRSLDLQENLFALNLTEVGEYHLVFDNSKGSSNKIITFAIDITNAKKDQIVKEDLDPLDVDLMEVHQQLNDIYFEHRFAQRKFDSGHKSMKDTNTRIMYFTLAETLMIITVTFWQIWFIKRLFSHQRMI